jgi:dephospho-CoA kinase
MTNERPFILCLTGSLGMGKSRTSSFFAEQGVPVYDSDAAVHALYAAEAAPLIESAFPGTTSDGQVDRTKLAARVVGDGAAMAELEAIVHPLVARARDAFITEAQAHGAAVVLLDVPLLFETGGERHCDAVVVVSAPLDMQRSRAFERPGMTEEKFAALVGKQMPDAEKRRRADFVVDSSRSFDHAREQVRDILRTIAKMRQGRGDSAK